MKKILMILAPGFEELEFVTPYDILKRGGIEVIIASTTAELAVPSVRGLVMQADAWIDLVLDQHFDMIFLPGGGPGTKNLRASASVRTLVCNQAKAGRDLAAICAAPLVLGDAGLLTNRKATCFPSCQQELAAMSVQVVQDRVVFDDGIFTSRGAGSAAEFAFALLAHLVNQAKSDEVKTQMQFAL